MCTKDSVNPSLNTLFKDGMALANWALQNICYGHRDVPGCNGGKGVGVGGGVQSIILNGEIK